MRRARTNGQSWMLLASLTGPIAWALHFTAVYATQTILNVLSGSRAVLIGTTFGYALLAAVAMAGVIRAMPHSGRVAYLRQFATGLALLSLVAIAWTCLSVATLDVTP
jgi:hypothetical protein